jgi:hypothetical protein
MLTAKQTAPLSFNLALNAMSIPAREAAAERSYALAISDKITYGSAFKETPQEFVRAILYRFNSWYSGLDQNGQEAFLMLVNLDFFTDEFSRFMLATKPELADIAGNHTETFFEEVRIFLAMHCYDKKIEWGRKGVNSFFSDAGQFFAVTRDITINGRSHMHEAFGRVVKNGCETKEEIRQIFQEVVMEFYSEIFRMRELPLAGLSAGPVYSLPVLNA